MKLLTIEEVLVATSETIRLKQDHSIIWSAYYVAMWVLNRFLGHEWMKANLMSPIKADDYLRTAPVGEYDKELHMNRVINLGELFFNLQVVPSVRHVFKAIKDDPTKLEDRVVELTAGKLLYLYQATFRFVPISQKKTFDYDLEMRLPDGSKACCEAKCKLETTELGLNTLKNSLTQARQQLPKEHCGIVIVSTPPSWLTDASFNAVMEEAARWFWTTTRRVALLVFYLDDFVLLSDHHFSLRIIQVCEFTNPRSRYVEKIGAGLFKTPPEHRRPWVDFVQFVRKVLAERPKPE